MNKFLFIFFIFLSTNLIAQDDLPSFEEIILYGELSKIKNEINDDITTRSAGSNIFKDNGPKTAIIKTSKGGGLGLGSGALVSDSGLIITNYHVIAHEGKISPVIMVGFCTSSKFDENRSDAIYRAEVISYLKDKDLALIKINSPNNFFNKPFDLENNINNISIGDDVHAIGSPEYQYCTYTRGFVSQIRDNYKWLEFQANIIQTQTPINPGNSGGPLISNDGKIIGINSFKFPDSPGLNYAVSSDEVISFLKNPPPIQKQQTSCKYSDDGLIENLEEVTIVKWDKDCDEYFERIGFDDNKDGKIDRYIFDRNNNLKWDFFILTVDYNGKKIFEFQYDNDEDGKIEEFCLDINNDSKPQKSECQKI